MSLILVSIRVAVQFCSWRQICIYYITIYYDALSSIIDVVFLIQIANFKLDTTDSNYSILQMNSPIFHFSFLSTTVAVQGP
jgi:hypothetical protein